MQRVVTMKLAIAVLAACTSFPVFAATITITPQSSDRPTLVMLEGTLVATDADQFIARTAPLRTTAIVALASDGGSLLAGLQIGEAIRQKGFSTIVPANQHCASACALAWLGGVERFIGANARIGFHAAYDRASGRETGVGNAVVGAYLNKIGLSYAAVVYITQVAPNDMTWLNMSDAAQRGIRVTLLSTSANETVVAIPTRYGDVIVTRDDECCVGHIKYENQQIKIASAGRIHPSLEGVYRVKEGDLVVISSPSGARGIPPGYYVLLVDQDRMTDVSGPDFGTSDGTFKATQRSDEVYFELGFQQGKKKSAIYRNGTLTVDIRSLGPGATLPRPECANVLNMVATCVGLPRCDDEQIGDHFAMAGQRYFSTLETHMPVFKTDNFYSVCTNVCKSKSYAAKPARSLLCGY